MVWIILGIVLVVALLPYFGESRKKTVRRAQKRAEEGHFADLLDGATYHEWHGRPTQSLIVLVHGLTTPSWVFSGLTRGLVMMGYQVLVYDLYGRGLSDRPRDPQTPQFFLRQLTELLDSSNVEGPVTLMGYSMGGVIATLFAATYPERMDRLILLAPGGMGYTPGPLLRIAGTSGALGDWLWRFVGGASIRRAARKEAKGPTVIPDLAKRMDEETRRRGYLRAVLSSHRETLGMDTENLHRDLRKAGLPVLAIWGEQDPIIPPSAIGKLTDWNRNTRHHVVKGAGHGLPHTAPNDVMGAIQEFLREV